MARGRLVLEFQPRGLVVVGETFQVRSLLKDQGGRWDPISQAWIFPHESKAMLIKALQGQSQNVPPIEDRAKVVLTLEDYDRGVLVTGETFPVKTFLREAGGTWNPKLRGWTFESAQKAHLLQLLNSSHDVGKVDDRVGRITASSSKVPGSSTSLVVLEAATKRPVASPALRASSSNAPGSSLVVLEAPSKRPVASPARRASSSNSPGSSLVVLEAPAKRPAASLACRETKETGTTSKSNGPKAAQVTHGQHKVTATAKRERRTETRKDGSRAAMETQSKQQKLSCKRTGKHVQTQSVTKKSKVVETKSKIVETRTIVVKRIRSKG